MVEESKEDVVMEEDKPIPSLKSLNGRDERVLIIKEYNGRYTGYHPIFSDLDLKQPYNPNAPKTEKSVYEKYSEIEVTIKVKDLVPLTFEA
jgi:hypothetical protein